MKRFLRENSLTMFFLVIFLLTLAAQSQASWRTYVDDQHAHNQPADPYSSYLVSADFSAKVMENWQSEFLQFSLYIMATIWLIQKGSSESKQEHEAGLQSDEEQRVGRHASADSPRWARMGSWRTTVYSNSLLIAMTSIFLLSWFAQSINGWDQYNADQHEHGQAGVAWTTYLHEPDFWDATLQTGSPSSWPSARWRSSASTCANEDPPRARPSVHLTRKPAPTRTRSHPRRGSLPRSSTVEPGWRREHLTVKLRIGCYTELNQHPS